MFDKEESRKQVALFETRRLVEKYGHHSGNSIVFQYNPNNEIFNGAHPFYIHVTGQSIIINISRVDKIPEDMGAYINLSLSCADDIEKINSIMEGVVKVLKSDGKIPDRVKERKEIFESWEFYLKNPASTLEFLENEKKKKK